MIADINQLVYYADQTDKLKDHPARACLIIADMIVSGEKEGLVYPSPKKVGIIATGTNSVFSD